MADAAQPGGGSKLVWILVVGLLGAVWWLASERNARKFTYEVRGGELIVSKGRYFPTGAAAVGPGDALGKVYAGIAPPAGVKPLLETEFDDQISLDRALYDLVTGWARAAAQKKDAMGQQQAEELVTRLSGLSGLTPAQLSDLQGLRAELGWWSAGRDLEGAVKQLAVARRKLEEVRRGDVEHAAQAGAMLAPLDALALQLTELAAGRGGPVVPTPAAPAQPAVPASVTPVSPAAPAQAVPAPVPLAAPAQAVPALAPLLAPAVPQARLPDPKGSGAAARAKSEVEQIGNETDLSQAKSPGSTARKGGASAPSSKSSGAPR